MKILIPLTILVLSFIIYYLFNAPAGMAGSEVTPVDTKTLTTEKKKEALRENYISNLASIKTTPSLPRSSQTDKEYLTLDDLRSGKFQHHKMLTKKVISEKSYNQMIFQQLKTILQQASSTYYSKRHIVLNSRISSILTSQNARERFKASLSSDFGLDTETIDKELKTQRTVWDWVMFLSP